MPRKFFIWLLLVLSCCLATGDVPEAMQVVLKGNGVQFASEAGNVADDQMAQSASVKKDLKVKAPADVQGGAPQPSKVHPPDESPPDEHVVVISERNLGELQADAKKKAATESEIDNKANKEKEVPTQKPLTIEKLTPPTGASGQQVHVEESSFKQKILHIENADMDLDSFQTGFYFFVGLSGVAILFIVFKIYGLRLSRAERKYGVQGDRTTQELTPLPISIEDGNSDEEDQTLFEINRQQIRIL